VHGTGETLLVRARATQRESERGIVPFERHGQQNRVRGKALQQSDARGGEPLVSVPETNRPEDKTTVLQTKLYQAAVRCTCCGQVNAL